MNIPRLREYFFIDGFFSSRAPLFPTGKHPHNCIILIYPKRKTKEKKIHTYIYVYMVLFYMHKDTQHREKKKGHLLSKKKKEIE
jgi:hypothetical protein